jgi:O-antigen/teichoic acid export membrane protein
VGVIAKMGQDQAVARYVATYSEQKEWGLLRGVLQFSFYSVSVVSLLCACLAALAIWMLTGNGDEELRLTLWAAVFLIPVQALMVPCGGAQQGLHRIVKAQLPNLLIVPVSFLVFLAGAHLLEWVNLGPHVVVILQLSACCIGLVFSLHFLRQAIPDDVRKSDSVFKTKAWIQSAIPLIFMGSMYVLNSNADILMLGSMLGAEAAGIYKASTRGAELVVFSLMIINPALSPIVSRLHTAGNRVRLQRGITRTARIGLLLALPIAAFLMSFGEWFLSLFGPEFVQGHMALSILSAGQVINVAAGSVAVILVMTGNERIAALGVAVSTLVNISLNALLIPLWGIEGAALATAISIVLWNVVLVRSVWTLLGVDPTSLGFLARRVVA